MKTYEIRDSFETGYGPNTAYEVAYVNDFEFEALSDADALTKAEGLQEKHDAIYREVGVSDDDFNNTPCYVNCLFSGDTKVEN